MNVFLPCSFTEIFKNTWQISKQTGKITNNGKYYGNLVPETSRLAGPLPLKNTC